MTPENIAQIRAARAEILKATKRRNLLLGQLFPPGSIVRWKIGDKIHSGHVISRRRNKLWVEHIIGGNCGYVHDSDILGVRT